MTSWLEALGLPYALARGVQILVALAIVAVLVRIALRFGHWAVARRNALRQGSRLSLLETLALDDKRRLVLVRHDNSEHLLLIGGATDLLIESPAAPRRRDEGRMSAPTAPAVAAPAPPPVASPVSQAATPAAAAPYSPPPRAASVPSPAVAPAPSPPARRAPEPPAPASERRAPPRIAAHPAAGESEPERPRPVTPTVKMNRANPRAPAPEARLDLDAWGESLLPGEGSEEMPTAPFPGHGLLRRPGAPATVEPFLPDGPEPEGMTEPRLPREPRLYEGEPFEPGPRAKR